MKCCVHFGFTLGGKVGAVREDLMMWALGALVSGVFRYAWKRNFREVRATKAI
jgi:hypothetical protein